MTNQQEMGGSEKAPENTREGAKTAKTELTSADNDLTQAQKEHAQEHLDKRKLAEEKERQEKKEESEIGLEIVQFEALVAECEAKYPIAEIAALKTMQEGLVHEGRLGLKKDLNPIWSSLKKIHTAGEAKGVTSEKFAELLDKYQRLSRAVGVLNAITKTVDHNITAAGFQV